MSHVRAVVIRPGLSWFAPAGEAAFFNQTPEWVSAQWSRIVVIASQRWFRGQDDGVVLLQVPGIPVAEGRDRAAAAARFRADLRALGWKVSDGGDKTGWYSCFQEGAPTIHFGVGPWIRQDRTSLFDLADHAQTIAVRLAAYESLTGTPWRGTAGLSGCASIRQFHESKAGGGVPMWRWDKAPGEIIGCSFELRPTHHRRPPTEAELTGGGLGGGFVHQYDVRAMYLAAAMNVTVSWSAPERRGPQEFDPQRAGYWQVQRSSLGDDPLELLTRSYAFPDPLVWVTTPVVAYAIECGQPVPEVFDSLTGARQSRVLRGWAERMRNAREHAGTAILPAIKDTYARTVGMLARPGGRIYRPDWRDSIVDLARINLLRKVRNSGVNPLRYNVDAIWVWSEYSDGSTGPILDTGRIGGLRYEPDKTLTMDAYLERFPG